MKNTSIKLCFFYLLICLFNLKVNAQTSKFVAECTITYSVNIEDNGKNEQTIKRLYVKGKKTRTEISNSSFYQATLFDNKTGEAIVLKEIGGDKYLSSFNAEQWKEKNAMWDSSSVNLTNETKKILNYSCRQAIITRKDGSNFIVYYTTDYIASATENPYQFKNIPGLILEYDSQTEKGKNIQFKVTDVNFSPVPASKFVTPSTGYRIVYKNIITDVKES